MTGVRRVLLMAACGAAAMALLPWERDAAAQALKETQKEIVPPGRQAPRAVGPQGPSGPVPRMPGGKPDLSGLWNGQRALPGQPGPEMQPWAAELTRQRTENYSAEDPEAHCLPGGVPRAIPYHHQIVQTPTLMLILFEGNIHSFRQIFLDRGEHLKNMQPRWYGDSIGSWDGDTLVVDTTGFNDKFWFDMAGHPHTTGLRVVERYHRRDFGNMEIQVTIDDPKTYVKPWVVERVASLETDIDMIEYVCNENNSDVLHLVGK